MISAKAVVGSSCVAEGGAIGIGARASCEAASGDILICYLRCATSERLVKVGRMNTYLREMMSAVGHDKHQASLKRMISSRKLSRLREERREEE